MHNHILGVFQDYDMIIFCTFENLKEIIKGMKVYNEYCIKVNSPMACYKYTELKDLLDKTKDTCFRRFDYCPDCGEKINYRKIIKENSEHEN